MIGSLVLFFVFITLSQAESQCASCQVANYWYSCGAVIFVGGTKSRCCNGEWCPCSPPPFPCDCCNKAATDNTTVLSDKYSYTKDHKLYTQYVTTAKLDVKTNTYYNGEIKHSSKLKLNDLVMWPKYDIDASAPTDQNIVMKVAHLNVTYDQSNCCGSISIGFPPSCHVKFCCGAGCCC